MPVSRKVKLANSYIVSRDSQVPAHPTHGLSCYFELTDVNFKEEKLTTRIYVKTELSAGFRI